MVVKCAYLLGLISIATCLGESDFIYSGPYLLRKKSRSFSKTSSEKVNQVVDSHGSFQFTEILRV